MEIIFASATRGTITTGISNRKYYYFTSAWKYNLHQHQQELLLFAAVSGTTTTCSSMEMLFASVSTTTNTWISIRIYYNLHQHVNSICISNNRNYYYLQQYQELLLLHQPQQKLLLLVAASGIFAKRLVDGKTNFSFPLVFQVTLLILLLLLHLSPPTYTHISHCPACLHHCSLVELDACLLAVWQQPGPAPAPVLDLTGLD